MTGKKKEKPRHLGRGLQSLLGPITFDAAEANQMLPDPLTDPNFPLDKELHNSLQEISIDAISPNPYQARTVWDEQQLADLAESIKTNGVIQPIIVRRGEAGFELIAGERRLRAAQ